MKRPCKYPGCNALLDSSGYCERHAASAPNYRRDYDQGRRKNDPALAQAAAIRNSAEWKRIARLKRSMNPLCEDPFGEHERRGATEAATQVHHIKGLASDAGAWRDWDNLMSVCTRCHARLEREARSATDDDPTQHKPSSRKTGWIA